MKKNSIRDQLFSTAAADGLSFVIVILTSVLVNRALQPEGKGMLAVVMNIVSLSFMISTFSVSKSFLFFFNQAGFTRGRIVGASFILFPASILLGMVILICANAVGIAAVGSRLLLIAILLLAAQIGQDLVMGILRAARHIHQINYARMAHQLFRVGAIGLLFLMGWLNLSTALTVEALAVGAALVFLLTVFRHHHELRPTFAQSTPALMKMIKWGMLYQLYSVTWQMHLKIDVLILKAFSTAELTGLYATAVNLSEIIMKVPNILLFVMTPLIAEIRAAKESLEYVARMSRISLPFFVIIGGVVWISAPYLVVGLYGEPFFGAVAPLRITLCAKIFSGLFMMISSFLVVTGKFAPLLVIQSAGLILNLGLNALLIPGMQVAGAAWASVASYGFCLISLVAYLVRTQKTNPRKFIFIHKNEVGMLFSLLGRKKAAA